MKSVDSLLCAWTLPSDPFRIVFSDYPIYLNQETIAAAEE